MNILNKYSNKKNIFRAGTILTGIISVIFLWGKLFADSGSSGLASSLSSIQSALSMIRFVVIGFYILAVLFIGVAVLAGFYYFKKNKDNFVLAEFILFVLMGLLFLLAIPGMHALYQLTNPTSWLSGGLDYNSLVSTGDYLKYINYLSLGTLIYNVFLILVSKKIINVSINFSLEEGAAPAASFDPVTGQRVEEPNNFDPMTGQPIQANTSDASTKPVEGANTGSYNATPQQPTGNFDPVTGQPIVKKSVGDTLKEFVGSRNGKIIIGVVLAVIVAFGGYKIYDSNFNKTSIDLAKNLKVEFNGESGNGYIKVSSNDIDYDKEDSDLAQFVSSTYYTYSQSSKLKNGDKVTVTVKYSQSTADELNLKVTNSTKTFTVKGLTERYKDASDVPEDLHKKVLDLVAKEATDEYKNSSYRTYKYELDSTYFGKGTGTYSSDSIYVVYKVTDTYTFFGSSQSSTYYDAFEVSDINSDSLKELDEDSQYLYGSKLVDKNYKEITSPSQIQEALHQKKSNLTFTKFK